MSTLFPTPDQTVGPYYEIGMAYEGSEQIVPSGSVGSITLSGYVYDGAGVPVPDAVIEIWQPDALGRVPAEPGAIRRRPGGFSGFGRVGSDDDGFYAFSTVLPGATEPGKAPFFAAIVFARGLLARLHTRIYVPGDDAALASDPLLAGLSPERRATLIAETAGDAAYRHDIHLQGERETVFLAFR
jgi:protocatechuate 3,4-dioxygenase, alpha subunit